MTDHSRLAFIADRIDRSIADATGLYITIPMEADDWRLVGAAVRAHRAANAASNIVWLPVSKAPDPSVNRSPGLTRHPVLTTETLWVRDADGRVYEAWFADATDEMGRLFWWGVDAETECDPVEWCPHPFDRAGKEG